MVIDHDDPVDLFVGVQLGDAVGDRLRVRVARLVGEADELAGEVEAPEAERTDAAAADADPAHLLALAAELPLQRERAAQDLRVERAREAAVARERDDGDVALLLALLEQRQSTHGGARACGAGHQLQHPVGVGSHRLDPALRLSQLRRSDELHRPRDLARVLNRTDAAFDVLDGRHYETSAASSSTLNDCRNCFIASSSFCAVSSLKSFVSRMSFRIEPSERRYSRSSSWKRGICATGTSSR